MENILKMSEILKKSKYLVFFGGAGTSTDSGIKDFRGKDGLYKSDYKGYSPEEILSINFFISNPKLFNEYIEEKLSIENIKPNLGHKALVKLEEKKILKSIITQNIDNLHQDAGSKTVIELHGTLKKWYCLKCGKSYNKNYNCECNGIVRPDVTLYGEELNQDIVEMAISELEKADTLIIAGTSLTVYPAAYYIKFFKGKDLIIINESPTQYDNIASISIKGNFSETMDKLLNLMEKQ